MEIEITSLLELDQFALSHSAHEGGQSAGRDTWNASLERADELPLLDTPDKLQAMRDFARSSGGWDGEEVSAWTDKEVNALFLQWIAGDCRQCPAIEQAYGPDDGRFSTADSLEEIDWPAMEAMQQEGQCPSNLFRADDGRIFFSLES